MTEELTAEREEGKQDVVDWVRFWENHSGASLLAEDDDNPKEVAPSPHPEDVIYGKLLHFVNGMSALGTFAAAITTLFMLFVALAALALLLGLANLASNVYASVLIVLLMLIFIGFIVTGLVISLVPLTGTVIAGWMHLLRWLRRPP